MLQAFGSIDGKSIHIKRPVENSQDCYKYKQLFALNVHRFIVVEYK